VQVSGDALVADAVIVKEQAMTITKFVIQNGRVAARESVSLDALDEGLLSTARDVLARLRAEQSAVSIAWSDKTEGTVGLGLPPLKIPVERLSEAQREAWVAGRDNMERTQRGTAFYVKTSAEIGFYSLAPNAAVFGITSPWNLSAADKPRVEMTNLAALYGAVAGTFGHGEMRKPAGERELSPSAERLQQFWDVATQIVAAAPAFICDGRLNGAAAAFADCFAMAMLSDPDASAARTTAA
jgi:hypothetical protein